MRRCTQFFLALTTMVTVGLGQQGPTFKWSGVVFADYYYNVTRDTSSASISNMAQSGAKDLNGFKIRRVYLTFDHALSDAFALRFRFETDESANASNGKIGTFVKDASIRWKGIFSGSDLTIGIQPPPAYEISEAAWGYRSLEKTVMDLRGAVSSRDQGISLHGDLVSGGTVRYWVMYANNSGNNPETDKYKRYYAHVEAHPGENLTATVYADLNARKPMSTATGTLGNNGMTYAGFVGYKVKDAYSLGFEGYMQSLDHGYVNAGSYLTRSTIGLSAFGTAVLSPQYTIIARFDRFDPNTHSSAKGDARNYIIAGLDWRPEPKISIIPNLGVETYESVAGRSIDASVTAKVTVSYSF